MEIFDLGLDNLDTISINLDDVVPDQKSSSSFGPGIELLMNNSKKSSSSSMNIDLGQLDNLEKELNELSGNDPAAASSSSSSSSSSTNKTLSGFANLFGFGSKPTAPIQANSNANDISDSKLGTATAASANSTSKTWDGFSKMNDIPYQPSSASTMTDREKRRKKRAMLKKLDDWYEKGHIKHTSHFNMDSAYDEIEDEYETAMEDKRKKDSVKLQGWWFMTAVNSLEYANAAFNPFDLNLDGWGEQVNEDIESYEEIFSELHDKYKGGKLAPELSLLLRIGFSAAVVNITNRALSTATPGFNDVIRQSPELMKAFTNATVQSMGNQNPAFEFANTMMNKGQGQGHQGPNSMSNSFGPPPAPVETKPTNGGRPSMNYTQHPGNRPDLAAGRGGMFQESGVNINDSYENLQRSDRSILQPSMNANQTPSNFNTQPPQQQQPRPEMRGPQNVDLNNIFAGLKSKEPPSTPVTYELADDNDSTISISSLKDLNSTSLPKRTGNRKQRSDKNIISLDI